MFRLLQQLLDNFVGNAERAEWVERAANAHYRGTRTIKVATRMCEDWGYSSSAFWFMPSSEREGFFQLAEEQLRANPKAWGRWYKWRRRIAKIWWPLGSLLDAINQNSSLPFRWHAWLYRASHGLQGNPNIVAVKV